MERLLAEELSEGPQQLGLRGPGRCSNLTGERLSGVRGVSAVGRKEAYEKISVRSSTGCVELDAWSSMIDSRIFLSNC